MKNSDNNANSNAPLGVRGDFVLIDNEKFYEIKNYDEMQPFFISLASDSNHWMYISSTGGLTAGRKNPDFALFPYYTDDKISESAEITGSKTIIHVLKNGSLHIWEPFSERQAGAYSIERSIAKSVIGNKLIFTEKNYDLCLSFSYSWMNSDEFGWIKKSRLVNESSEEIDLYIVDGLQNVLPSGIDRLTQNTFSALVDGYKKTELIEKAGLVLFRMESILVDRAEPSESLRTNTIWCVGLENSSFLLSSAQLSAVRNGEKANPETEAKGVRGAIFTCANLTLTAGSAKDWYFVAEVAQDIVAVNNLIDFIENTSNIPKVLELNVAAGTQALKNIVAQADGIQETADENGMARHFANVLFNTMRGGIFSDNYNINVNLFRKHVKLFNVKCAEKHQQFLLSLPNNIEYTDLKQQVEKQQDANLLRLFMEYLPLTFSRRHGDPSRPWNSFDINIKDQNGDKLLSFEGNWRDIFQNWEALSLAYPLFVNSIIAKFVNATSVDGYNAYRLTNKGIEWEEIEPDNPWSNIGYWGDHQIIYLQKLLENAYSHYPNELLSMLNNKIFVYSNIPYRIKTYSEIVANPKETIRFDSELHHQILKNEAFIGADAKLVLDHNQEPIMVTFTEKLLATFLAKMSNFIPETGIWLNTQRPEWNDANNALVGTGASMVTVYYLRRFVSFVKKLYTESVPDKFDISSEMYLFFEDVFSVLIDSDFILIDGCDNCTRRKITDELGIAGQKFRDKAYNGFVGQKSSISKSELVNFFELTLAYIDHSIAANKRIDNMYHAYNLAIFNHNELEIRHLYEMLEGQVAVMSSGVLTANEAVQLLDALRKSELYRADQNSYILYPNKTLPSFLDKNNIPAEDVLQNPVLKELIASGNKSIVLQDNKGGFHFNANFKNVGFLRDSIKELKLTTNIVITEADQKAIEAIYEKIFDHQSFTGRSGTFYKYEGLGCIYWHMVSKLLLAIGESILQAEQKNEDKALIQKLKAHYEAVKAGIGAHKSPAAYGAFPFDPYSHTPTMAGAQQPGMTGQVKEDIISRFFELGIVVKDGCIEIHPENINFEEFIITPYDSPELSFTYCSVLFKYKKNGRKGFEITYHDNSTVYSDLYYFSKYQSDQIFKRDKTIKKVEVFF